MNHPAGLGKSKVQGVGTVAGGGREACWGSPREPEREALWWGWEVGKPGVTLGARDRDPWTRFPPGEMLAVGVSVQTPGSRVRG